MSQTKTFAESSSVSNEGFSKQEIQQSRIARLDLYEIYINKDEEKLHLWIRDNLGFSIPTKAVCTDIGHVAPFRGIADPFLYDWKDYIVIGGRSSGKTLGISILNALWVLCFDNCEVLSAGAIEVQSERAFMYFTRFLRLPIFSSIVNKDMIGKHVIQFNNGSISSIVPATVKQMNGPHPPKLIIDELELVSPEALSEATFMPNDTMGIPAQIVMTTSRKYPFGLAEREIQAIMSNESEKELITFCQFEALQTCREDSCAPCKLKRRSDGKTFYDICVLTKNKTEGSGSNGEDEMRAKLAQGHYGLRRMWSNFTSIQTDPATFDSQALSRGPSKEGLIYPMLDERVHLKPAKWFEDRLLGRVNRPWQMSLGLDFGYRDPTVVLFGLKDGEFLYILDEIYESGKMPEEYYQDALFKLKLNGWEEFQTGADPSNPGLIQAWRNAGFNISPVDNDWETGTIEVQNGLRWLPSATEEFGVSVEPRIYISENCKNTWKEMTEYHFRQKKPEEMAERARRKPDPYQSDHCPDALRYLMMLFYGSTISATVMPGQQSFNGGWTANKSDGW